jgi:adenosylcobinamide kinase / adenosylcobinamide-phosphate guanylyltransferase
VHFVTGGAFHGKAKWVTGTYNLSREDNGWFVLKDGIPASDDFNRGNIVVLEGIEQMVRSTVLEKGESAARETLSQVLESWLIWDASKDHQLILIGTDIGKGIVPMEQENRMWRDFNGWFFQDIAKKALRVDLIWYGIPQLLKGKGDGHETIYENGR